MVGYPWGGARVFSFSFLIVSISMTIYFSKKCIYLFFLYKIFYSLNFGQPNNLVSNTCNEIEMYGLPSFYFLSFHSSNTLYLLSL